MALTDTGIRAAKPKTAQYKLHDEKGLFAIVRPSGGKLWRFKYRYQGKEQQLSLGTYPEVSLKAAREGRDAARKLLAEGVDPGAKKKHEREGRASATVAKDRWHLSRLTKLHSRPIAEIEAYEVLAELRKLEARGNLEAARQVRSFASRVFRYGVATTRAKRDVAADLIGALTSPKVKNHAAIVDPVQVGALLRSIEGYEGQPSTHLAFRLAPHLFTRPGELRQAEWAEVDLDAAVWTIPAIRTKMRKEHAVPLSRQAVAILRKARKLSGENGLVFPGLRGARPISSNTMNAALRRLGYGHDDMTAHGFRAMASTLLNQSGKWRPYVIERALAHGERDKIRAAYNRAQHWEERVEMAQWWSDYLDKLRAANSQQVLPSR